MRCVYANIADIQCIQCVKIHTLMIKLHNSVQFTLGTNSLLTKPKVDLQGSVQRMVKSEPFFPDANSCLQREREVVKCQRRNYATSACLKVMEPKVMRGLRGY